MLLAFLAGSKEAISTMRATLPWIDESPECWPSDITFANPTGHNGFTSQQCNKVINTFTKASAAYMKGDSIDVIKETFEEETVRSESDIVNVLIFFYANPFIVLNRIS